MPIARVMRSTFLKDRQEKKLADAVNDPEQPFDVVLQFFSDADRQRRMEESELHHDRAPLAGGHKDPTHNTGGLAFWFIRDARKECRSVP